MMLDMPAAIARKYYQDRLMRQIKRKKEKGKRKKEKDRERLAHKEKI
ncbi:MULTISPECIES: hypothetical protein [Enterobacter]|nr:MULTISPECIES: hypothetical protein [Enterobacter]MCM7635749.1 hypothetical protein [Enterobacter bugandensis]UJC75576.1 hypothetical protein J4O68_09935 [Enterobacter hormaechei]